MYPHLESSHRARARRGYKSHPIGEIPTLFGMMQENLSERTEIERFEPHRSEFFKGLVRAIRRKLKPKSN